MTAPQASAPGDFEVRPPSPKPPLITSYYSRIVVAEEEWGVDTHPGSFRPHMAFLSVTCPAVTPATVWGGGCSSEDGFYTILVRFVPGVGWGATEHRGETALGASPPRTMHITPKGPSWGVLIWQQGNGLP